MWLWNNKSGHTHKRIKTDNEFGRLLTANLNLDKYIHLSCILNWPLSSVISTTKQHTTYFSGSRPLYCQRRLLTSGVRSEESALHCVLAQSDHPWCSGLARLLNAWCRWQLITIKAALFDRLRHIHLFNVVRVDILHDGLGGSKVFKCPACRMTADRDVHAARNILLRCLSDPWMEGWTTWCMNPSQHVGFVIRISRLTSTWQTWQSSRVIKTCVCVVDVLQ